MELDVFSAFVIGLLGAGHCIGMCGGVSTMLTSALNKSQNSVPEVIEITENIDIKPRKKTASISTNNLIIHYNIGRIFSYSILGALVGFTGSVAAKSIGMPLSILRIFSAMFVILLGLYIGQWLFWLSKVEAIGKVLWQKLSPLTKYCLPVDSSRKALLLGGLWGWLPCGLVYSMLTWALASGDVLKGAMIMAAFGLGTLPALLTISFGVVHIKTLLKNTLFRKISALSLITYGAYSLYVLL